MKKFTLVITLFLSVFMISTVTAQSGVSKAELLRTVNNVDDLGFSNDKKSALNDFNKGFVDDIFDITGSKKSNEDKISGLKNLRSNNKDELFNLLGEDGFKKFKKSMKKQLKPLKRRSKLLKYII